MCFCTNPGIRQRFSHIPNNPQTTTYFEYESFLLVPFLKIIFQPYTYFASLQLCTREGRWIFRVMGLNKKLAVFNFERESFVKLLKVPVPGTHLLNLLLTNNRLSLACK